MPTIGDVSGNAPWNEVTGLQPIPAGGGGFSSFLSANPGLASVGGAGLAAGGGALLGGLLGGDKGVPFASEIQGVTGGAGQEANYAYPLIQTGSTLEQGLLTGQLPPGAEAALQLQQAQAMATSQGRYGALGLGGSTMAADAAAQITNQTSAMRFQIAQQMFQQGLDAQRVAFQTIGNDLGIQMGGYENLAKLQMQEDQNMAATIGNFAKAFGMAAGVVAAPFTGGASLGITAALAGAPGGFKFGGGS